ncbi:MAG: ribosome assembly cofactor RimP [Bacteroidetes bacterium]|nr:ribosome assembly cofactor RimP [Bacteroidota bacterium]
MDVLKDKIEELVENVFDGTDRFLVDILISTGNQHVKVFIDADDKLTIDHCTKISRYLEQHLEQEDMVDEHYTLEVSSPGLDQPLKLLRQYKKNVGRNLKIELVDGSSKEGELLELSDMGIMIDEMVKQKPVKKVKTEINFDKILRTLVKIKFSDNHKK